MTYICKEWKNVTFSIIIKQFFREINSLVISIYIVITLHSVEKYYKTLSRAKFFCQTTQQKYAKTTFTNA